MPKTKRWVGFTASYWMEGEEKRNEAWFNFALDDEWNVECLVFPDVNGHLVIGGVLVVAVSSERKRPDRSGSSRPLRFFGERTIGRMPASGFRATALRKFKIGDLEGELSGEAKKLYLRWVHHAGLRPMSEPIPRPHEKRKPELDVHYAKVAKAYCDAVSLDRPAHREVARKLGLREERVGYAINQARKRGLLTRTKQEKNGVKGGELTGLAHTLLGPNMVRSKRRKSRRRK